MKNNKGPRDWGENSQYTDDVYAKYKYSTVIHITTSKQLTIGRK